MFKSLTKKLATIPTPRNSTLQPPQENVVTAPDSFQELIAAEELILNSLRGLNTGFGQAIEAWKTCIGSEDEDLKNMLSTCSKLLNHWISSFESSAMYIARSRECLKDLRTKEEALEHLHRLRQPLFFKADAAGPEYIEAPGPRGRTQYRLNTERARLQREILAIDTEIRDTEKTFGDRKRIQVKEWKSNIFGALLECSEKGTVVATLGRTIIGNLSTGTTPPVLPLAHYSGKLQVGSPEVEAGRRLDNVSSPVPAGRVGDETELPSNEGRTDGIPMLPLPHNVPPKVLPKPTTAVESQRGTTNNRSQYPQFADTHTQFADTHPQFASTHTHFTDTIGGQIQLDLETGRSRAPNHPSSSQVVVPVPPVQVKSEPLQDQQRMNPPVTARSDRKDKTTSLHKLPQRKVDELAQERGLQEPEPFDGSPSGPGRSHDPNLGRGGHLQR